MGDESSHIICAYKDYALDEKIIEYIKGLEDVEELVEEALLDNDTEDETGR